MECVCIKEDLMLSCPQRPSKFQANSSFQLINWLRQLENAIATVINSKSNFIVVLELISC